MSTMAAPYECGACDDRCLEPPEIIARTLFDRLLEPRLRSHASRAWRHWRNRGALAHTERLIGDILPALPSQPGLPPPATWQVRHLNWTEGDVVVAMVGPTDGGGAAVLKIPHTPACVGSLARQAAVLAQLHEIEALGTWRALLPTTILDGDVRGQRYFAESILPGRDMGATLEQPGVRLVAYRSAISAIRSLHQATAEGIVVDAGVLRRWVDVPAHELRQLVRSQQAVNDLVTELHAELSGQAMRVSWIHGDFWPGNLLVAEDRMSLTGIVDWDLAEPGSFPMHDVLNLLFSVQQIVGGRGLGDIVRDRLNGGPWSRETAAILDEAQHALLANVSERTMLLLYWLRFITTYLRKCPVGPATDAGCRPTWSACSRRLGAADDRRQEAEPRGALVGAGRSPSGAPGAIPERPCRCAAAARTQPVPRRGGPAAAAVRAGTAGRLARRLPHRGRLSQMVADYLHPDPFMLGKVADVLADLPAPMGRPAAELVRGVRSQAISLAAVRAGAAPADHLARSAVDVAGAPRRHRRPRPGPVRVTGRAPVSHRGPLRGARERGDRVPRRSAADGLSPALLLPELRSAARRPGADCAPHCRRWPDRNRPLIVVGSDVRQLSGAAVHGLPARGRLPRGDDADRSAGPDARPARAASHACLVQRDALVLLTDDPPQSGKSVARAANDLVRLGVPAASIVLLLQTFGVDDTLPPALQEYQAVVLSWADWGDPGPDSRRRHWRGAGAAGRPERAGGPGGAPAAAAAILAPRPRAGAVSGADRGARAVPATSRSWCGDRASGTSAPRPWPSRTPSTASCRACTASRTACSSGPGCRRIARSPSPRHLLRVSCRSRRGVRRRAASALAVTEDISARMLGEWPAWEVASNTLSQVFGRAWMAARIPLVDPIVRRLLRTIDAGRHRRQHGVESLVCRVHGERDYRPFVKVGFDEGIFRGDVELAGVCRLRSSIRDPGRPISTR